MFLSRFCVSAVAVLFGFAWGPNLYAQTASTAGQAQPVGFVVPEWKSENGKFKIRARGRALHDFYSVSRDFDGGSINGNTDNNELRRLRFGVDGQFSPNTKFRADANLLNGDINWADVYIGHSDSDSELIVGQQRLATALENASSSTNAPLTESSLVTLAFGQDVRSFGVIGRIKQPKWQVVGGLYHGNINAGDIFGNDVVRYAQIRGTYAIRNKDRDVIHVGASLRARDAQGGPLLRYATRPAATVYGPRTLDTGAIATSDTTFSLEGLWIKGSMVVTAEHQMLEADTASGVARLNGSYLEGAWYLTGETRRYSVSEANLGGVKPRRSIRAGGTGAVALVGRLERLDQSDARFGARAGRVEAASLGLMWVPVDFVMFRLAAAHSRFSGLNPSRNGTANVITGRAQFAF